MPSPAVTAQTKKYKQINIINNKQKRNKKKRKNNYKKVIREISGGSHHVFSKPVESTVKVFSVFFHY